MGRCLAIGWAPVITGAGWGRGVVQRETYVKGYDFEKKVKVIYSLQSYIIRAHARCFMEACTHNVYLHAQWHIIIPDRVHPYFS